MKKTILFGILILVLLSGCKQSEIIYSEPPQKQIVENPPVEEKMEKSIEMDNPLIEIEEDYEQDIECIKKLSGVEHIDEEISVRFIPDTTQEQVNVLLHSYNLSSNGIIHRVNSFRGTVKVPVGEEKKWVCELEKSDVVDRTYLIALVYATG